MSTFLEQMRAKHGIPMQQPERNKPKEPLHYHAHFMGILNRTGVFYISDEALQDEKNACLKTGVSFQSFLTENKLVLDKTKSGWKISKKKDLAVMKNVL